MRWHVNSCLSINCVLTSPEGSDSLELRVEVQSGFAIKVVSSISGNGVLVTSEGKHWEWDGDGNLLIIRLAPTPYVPESMGWDGIH